MNNLNVKTGDNVVVIAGKDKGKTGRVIAADPSAKRVTVENVNVVTKHKKPRGPQNPGGKVKEPAGVDVSNVQIICPSCNKATRVGHAEQENGKKIRVCKKCGASLDAKVKADKKGKKGAKAEAEKPEKKKAAKAKKAEEAAENVAETVAEEKPAKKSAKKADAKKGE